MGRPVNPPDPNRPLPELRPELRLVKGAAGRNGEPGWLVHDPVRHRFIQIDDAVHHILSQWQGARTRGELVGRVAAKGRVDIDLEGLDRLIDFLHRSELTATAPERGWRHFADTAAQARHSLAMRVLHGYLMFRIPVVRPQAFLTRTLPLVRGLASTRARAVIATLGLVGIYLVSRQWDAFLATFDNFFTWEGAAMIAVALFLVKAAHELGHAYVATHYGCRVPTIGVAVMLLVPMLYTDVTDAWRLRDRRQRLRIDSAGVMVEIAIAAVAIFLWSFLPDGPARSVAFVLGVASLATSLIINLNPFMRFDGYYLFSEMLGIENLQHRSFAMGRWKLREVLLGLRQPPPEQFSRRMTAILVAYAYATWIYRLGLFIGIALLVYHFFFKALGVLLFLVEIGWFVARPVWTELKTWVALWPQIRASRRWAASATLAALAVVAMLIPWTTRVEIPAVIERAELQRVHPVRPARIVSVHVRHGDRVAAGAPLLTMTSPDLDHEIEQTRTRLRLARLQHARRGADAADREASMVLENMITALGTKIAGLEQEKRELVVRAPFGGRVAEMGQDIHPGRWIGPRDMVAMIAGEGSLIARGYVAEADVWRVRPGNQGRYIPEHAMRAHADVVVGQIAASGAASIEIVELASTSQGRIAVRQGENRTLIPTGAQYLVEMQVAGTSGPAELALRGVVVVDGAPESIAARVWRHALKVLVREAGA